MPTQLLSTADVGRRLDVSRERARQLIASDDFPAPVQQVGRTRLWDPADIERWIGEHRPDDVRRDDELP